MTPASEVPTLDKVVGHNWAADISSHAQVELYLAALANAAPTRCQLTRYGTSYEGRALYYLAISSEENIARLAQLREQNQKLADPRLLSPAEAEAIAADQPAFVWLAYCIHGNEATGTDAALLTAYHLLSDTSETTREWLRRTVVFIDPLQNPDGRDRFIHSYREMRGEFADAQPFAAEHTERWPGGRFNHYLFDLNRDWYLQSQTETVAKVAAYLEWQPHIYVDAHEMGRNSTYFFPPPRDPINEFVLPRQKEWYLMLGRRQAEHFDRHGFRYTTREIFDEFFPGYGSSWPLYHGAEAALWEQAGARGLVVLRDDETELYYHDGVRHHYVSSLATVELASEHRKDLVLDLYKARARAIQLGQEGPVRDFFLVAGERPSRAERLARLLTANGVEIRRLTAPLTIRCTSAQTGEARERTVPGGSYHISVAQPAGRLIRVLLDRHIDMGRDFVARQLARQKERQPHEIYDITAWSMALAWDVECLASGEPATIESDAWDGAAAPTAEATPAAEVAYLVDGTDDSAVLALAEWLRLGYRVHVADQPLVIQGQRMPRGTLVLLVAENSDSLPADVAATAGRYGLRVVAANTAFVDEGAHLGGPHVQWVRPPIVGIVVDQPASYGVGHTWHVFDQWIRYPTTRIAGRHLSELDLDNYNVLVLPEGEYNERTAPSADWVARVKRWVAEGGTLVLVGDAAKWATKDEVGLLASRAVEKPIGPMPMPPADKSAPPQPEATIQAGEPTSASQTASKPAAGEPSPAAESKSADTEPPQPVPGAFLRASVFADHWLAFGCDERLDVLYSSGLVLEPLAANKGRNVVTFAPRDELVVSGFAWPETLDLLAGKPYLVHQPLGSGHIVVFADDPNFREMSPALIRLFVNAVFFGPGH